MSKPTPCTECGKVPEFKERKFDGFSEAAPIAKHWLECGCTSTGHESSPARALAEWEFLNQRTTIDVDFEVVDDVAPAPPRDNKIKLDESQLAAIDKACNSRFCIVSGGAGSGKTTIIKNIAERLSHVKLCAFAGKAAARLKEATGYNATTIHRMLLSNGKQFRLETLRGCTVIVDEASMVASDLMAEIVRREPKRLILVGDEAQLSPVGKGQPFHDMITHRPECVSNLTTCYRNREAVFAAAMKIRVGEYPERLAESAEEKWQMIQTGSAHETQRWIVGLVEAGMIDFSTDIILCPRNGKGPEAPCTVAALNAAIVAIVNPRDGDEKFKVGDRIINTKNISEKDVWNGTTGSVHAIDHDGNIWMHLDIPIVDKENSTPKHRVYKERVKISRDEVKGLHLAYALTVHKSQGSQYRKVIVVALERDSRMLLSRSLVYTAVTRTQKECIVVGQLQALWSATQKVDTKRTVMQELARTTQQQVTA